MIMADSKDKQLKTFNLALQYPIVFKNSSFSIFQLYLVNERNTDSTHWQRQFPVKYRYTTKKCIFLFILCTYSSIHTMCNSLVLLYNPQHCKIHQIALITKKFRLHYILMIFVNSSLCHFFSLCVSILYIIKTIILRPNLQVVLLLYTTVDFIFTVNELFELLNL